MTTLMDKAIDALRHVPSAAQDDLARVVLELTGNEQPLYVCTPEEDAELTASEAEADLGKFASEEHVRAIWAKHGL